jgi:hypothetical protein
MLVISEMNIYYDNNMEHTLKNSADPAAAWLEQIPHSHWVTSLPSIEKRNE